MKTVITYGTFDLLHFGHIEILRRAKILSENGKLIVGLSTDEFNTLKGKETHLTYSKREALLNALTYVDEVIPETDWEQKTLDIKKHRVDIMVMGDDWRGKFDDLRQLCDVFYLERTPDISSSLLKQIIKDLQKK